MKSAAYWKKRFEMLEKASHAMGQETLRELQPAFDAAERELRKEITMWFTRFAQNNNVSYTEAKRMLDKKSLKELKWDVQQYIKAGEENGISGDFTKELENASARVHISRLQEIQIKTQMIYEKLFGKELQGVTSMAENILASDYYHTCFELMKGYGIGWRIGEIAQNDLAKIVTKPWTTDGRTFSDRIWSNKNKVISELHQELSRTLILGKSPDEAIERMSSLAGKSVKNARAAAVRLVQTEQAYFHSVSTERAFNDLDVEEFEIVATLDTHTSEICQDMDGQHFKMKDYEIGVTVPPFHPNCRSVVVPYFDDLDETSMRAARDSDGKTYLVPAGIKYKDWKRSFVKPDPEQYYRKVIRGRSDRTEVRGVKVPTKKIENTVNDIYLSDNLEMKPRAMHEADVAVTDICREFDDKSINLPKVSFVSHTDIKPTIGGKYDCVKNEAVVAYGANYIETLRHELWHWKQAEEYRRIFGEITEENRNDYLTWLRKRCKKRIDKMGITEYNVSEISLYAQDAWQKKVFDEVEAEFYSYHKLR